MNTQECLVEITLANGPSRKYLGKSHVKYGLFKSP
jgi:hypothetical protein